MANPIKGGANTPQQKPTEINPTKTGWLVSLFAQQSGIFEAFHRLLTYVPTKNISSYQIVRKNGTVRNGSMVEIEETDTTVECFEDSYSNGTSSAVAIIEQATEVKTLRLVAKQEKKQTFTLDKIRVEYIFPKASSLIVEEQEKKFNSGRQERIRAQFITFLENEVYRDREHICILPNGRIQYTYAKFERCGENKTTKNVVNATIGKLGKICNYKETSSVIENDEATQLVEKKRTVFKNMDERFQDFYSTRLLTRRFFWITGNCSNLNLLLMPNETNQGISNLLKAMQDPNNPEKTKRAIYDFRNSNNARVVFGDQMNM